MSLAPIAPIALSRYAFITVMQEDQHMIAPNAVFDQLTGEYHFMMSLDVYK